MSALSRNNVKVEGYADGQAMVFAHGFGSDVAVGDYVDRALPDSRLVLLDATGHCPNLSAPEETNAAMQAFFTV